MPQPRQPFLHDLVCTLAAPTQVWSGYDGQIGAAAGRPSVGGPGCPACGRTRAGTAELRANGQRLEHIATLANDATTRFVLLWHAVRPAGHPDTSGTDRPDPAGRAGPGSPRRSPSPRQTPDPHRRPGGPGWRTTWFSRADRPRSGEPAVAVPFGDQPLVWGDDELTVRVSSDARRTATCRGSTSVSGSTWHRSARSGWGGRTVIRWTARSSRPPSSAVRAAAGAGLVGARPCGRAGPPTRCLAQPGRRGPQRAPDDDPAAAGRGVLRRRRALVPHPLRTRQPVGGPDGAAARSGAGDRTLRVARPAGRDHDRCGQRAAARQDRARAARGRPRASARSRCHRCTTAPSTPPRSGSACCSTCGGAEATTTWSPSCSTRCGPRSTGSSSTAMPTATGSSSTSTAAGTGWPTRAGRTPPTRSGSPTAGLPPVRWRCVRCRAYAYEALRGGADLLEAFGRPCEALSFVGDPRVP